MHLTSKVLPLQRRHPRPSISSHKSSMLISLRSNPNSWVEEKPANSLLKKKITEISRVSSVMSSNLPTETMPIRVSSPKQRICSNSSSKTIPLLMDTRDQEHSLSSGYYKKQDIRSDTRSRQKHWRRLRSW